MKIQQTLFCTVILLVGIFFFAKLTPAYDTSDLSIYDLELARWGVYNDGTHPMETTKGINNALRWAHENGKTTFKVPAGTYLIWAGDKFGDPNAQINLVSNMTFWLDDQAVIQKQTNGYQSYNTIYIAPGVNNVTIKGGEIVGDKDTHDYTRKNEAGTKTHEWGMGIEVKGGSNVVIDGVKIHHFTGDGIETSYSDGYVDSLVESDLESGSIDDQGNLVEDTTKIRIKNTVKTVFKNSIFQTRKFMQLSYPKGISKDSLYNIYFYKHDGTFISNQKDVHFSWEEVAIPNEADYFQAVFNTSTTTGVKIRFDSKLVSKHNVIKNCELSFNRRQGISVVGAEDVLITDNEIHDIKGTAPQSGIDLESEVGLNHNIKITNNKFYNNAAYNVVLFDGWEAVVDNNYFGNNQKGSTIGLTSDSFRDSLITNNVFDSRILGGHDMIFKNNTINSSLATFTGPNVLIDGLKLNDTYMIIKSTEPFGVTVTNVVSNNTGKNPYGPYAIGIYGQPVHLSNATIKGLNKLNRIVGDAKEESIFDNVDISN